MKLNQISIENFKGIENRIISFDSNFSLLIGKSGIGKSTVLDAISIGLDVLINNFQSEFGKNFIPSKRKISDSEKRREISYDSLITSFEPNLFLDFEKIKFYVNEDILNKILTKESNLEKAIKLKDFTSNSNYPLFVYISQCFEYSISKQAIIDDSFIIYNNCLRPNENKLDLNGWLKYLNSNSKYKIQFKALLSSLEGLLPNWTDIYFNEDLSTLVGKNDLGFIKPYDELSEGHKKIISLFTDLAIRSLVLNPNLEENVLSEAFGIVLIDNIDFNLHPTQQKNIIGNLKKTFPKIQFITTSNSPFIIQSFNKSEVINLDDEIIDKDPFTISIEDILEEYMSVENVQRSQRFLHYQYIAAKYFDLIEEGKENKEQLDTIKLQLDELENEFSSDPVYLALMQAERKSLNKINILEEDKNEIVADLSTKVTTRRSGGRMRNPLFTPSIVKKYAEMREYGQTEPVTLNYAAAAPSINSVILRGQKAGLLPKSAAYNSLVSYMLEESVKTGGVFKSGAYAGAYPSKVFKGFRSKTEPPFLQEQIVIADLIRVEPAKIRADTPKRNKKK